MEQFLILAGPSLEGQIRCLSESGFIVDMNKPYPGLSDSLHIPYFSMGFKKGGDADGGTFAYRDAGGSLQITKYGLESARRALLEMDEACKAVERHQRALRRQCAACRAAVIGEYIQKAAAANEAFYADRAALSKAKESGRMGKSEYARGLKTVEEMERDIARAQYDAVVRITGAIGQNLARQLIARFALDQPVNKNGQQPADLPDRIK